MMDEISPVSEGRAIVLEEEGPEALFSLDRNRTLIIIPFAPVEYHGNHLPFSTDLILAESFSRASAESFLAANPTWNVIIYPVVPIGADCVPHPGSVAVSLGVIERAARALARHFIRQGFTRIVLMSGHGGVNHDRALERASRKLNRRYRKKNVRVIAPLGRVMFKLWAEGIRRRLNPLLERKIAQEEERDFLYELHGGWWETSMVLAHHPERTDETYRRTPDYLPKTNRAFRLILGMLPKILPARHGRFVEETKDIVLVGLSWFWGNTGAGYLGFPSRAHPEMGHAVTKVAGEEFARLFREIFIEGADVREAESIYSLLDLVRWYALGLVAAVLAVVGLIIL